MTSSATGPRGAAARRTNSAAARQAARPAAQPAPAPPGADNMAASLEEGRLIHNHMMSSREAMVSGVGIKECAELSCLISGCPMSSWGAWVGGLGTGDCLHSCLHSCRQAAGTLACHPSAGLPASWQPELHAGACTLQQLPCRCSRSWLHASDGMGRLPRCSPGARVCHRHRVSFHLKLASPAGSDDSKRRHDDPSRDVAGSQPSRRAHADASSLW